MRIDCITFFVFFSQRQTFVCIDNKIIYSLNSNEVCNGQENCCHKDNKCGENEGDCNSDSDCKEGLSCGSNNCPSTNSILNQTTFWDAEDDCCYQRSCFKQNPCGELEGDCSKLSDCKKGLISIAGRKRTLICNICATI